ncbi:hypothetical protein [Kitasatospora azatica]|uniref:hypothetical protein n=1 Tax=Kitasatospora azatica TaxID=58347 RepID=UPI000567BFF2|nr:hypothetical protein [Kitasatospora azatica]
MDIDAASTITEAITAAAGAAGTAVGRQAWEALQAVARRTFRRGEPGAELTTVSEEPVDPADQQQVRELITTLIDRREQDPELAAELADWVGTQVFVVKIDQTSTVSNTVRDNAQVTKLVQGRDFGGSITL